ncbi:DUF6311 domain-containing protein [Pseudomonas denitrificans (nom. rej.)]|uniref:YfhO family protein n=1 Tax=Pseudomonas denitrificans TaxID=43306 RepID=A0A9X7N4M8_PSEDE|nr:DUF6311 domain-containing protein [Pseudomonas denitrificans (nom. rej.)]QEY74621.1 hypothetical protein F1C79_25040 [Pseudomonas denitrificans (nom. rej.)]
MSQFQPLPALNPVSASSSLWREVPARVAYPVALLMAAAFVLYLYPLSFLAGHGLYFEGGDAASHVAGWLFFEKDEWRFPLLQSVRLNAPDGISIAFTDSIPLLALLLKPARALLPDGFHYFGLWHAFSYLLQALAATLLIRSLNVRHLPGTLLAVAFSLTWPALTHRLGHTALMTQGLLLLALAFYFRGSQTSWSIRRSGSAFITLTSAALLIHPYLLAMTYPVFIAYLVRQLLSSRLSLRQGASWLAGSLATLLALMYVCGYFIGKGAATAGFGIYSLNLLAPFCGGMLCDFADATGGQGEGFNYLGAGTLLLALLALLSRGPELLRAARRHWPLLLVLLGFTLYAASHRIFIGQLALLDLHLPHRLEAVLGVFRVSGRFFWLVGYSVLFAVLAVLLRRNSVVVLVLAVAALLLQWQDTLGLRGYVQYQTRLPSTLDLAPWRSALAGVDAIDIYPAYGCSDTPTDDYVRYQYIAAKLGLTINSAYTARTLVDCAQKSAFANAPAEPSHLYVKAGYSRNALDVPPLFLRAMDAGECRLDSIHLICASRLDGPSWDALGPKPTTAQQDRSARWSAAQLPTLIGQLQDKRLVPRQKGAVGYLSFGPYTTLSAGPYRYSIDYLSQADSGTTTGNWDLVGESSPGQRVTLTSGPLTGTRGQPVALTGGVTLERPLQRVELRLFSNGGDVQLEAITLSTAQPAASPRDVPMSSMDSQPSTTGGVTR